MIRRATAPRALFEGYRGKPGADKEALARTLVAVSQMAMALAPACVRWTSIRYSSGGLAGASSPPTR